MISRKLYSAIVALVFPMGFIHAADPFPARTPVPENPVTAVSGAPISSRLPENNGPSNAANTHSAVNKESSAGAQNKALTAPTASRTPIASDPTGASGLPAAPDPANAEAKPEASPLPFPIPNKSKNKKNVAKAEPKLAPTAKESATSKISSNLPQILQEVEAKYAQAETLQANFTQINEIAALKTKKTSTGVIMVKRPDKLRWETLRPDMNLLVSDGKRFWFYTPPFDEGEHGQVIEKKSNEINSKLANALLSGRFSVAHDMKIKQEGTSKFQLTPKAGTAGSVSRAEIEINPEQKIIEKVVLEHKGGNRSEISLTKIELGKKLGDEAFIFTAPPGTDKLE